MNNSADSRRQPKVRPTHATGHTEDVATRLYARQHSGRKRFNGVRGIYGPKWKEASSMCPSEDVSEWKPGGSGYGLRPPATLPRSASDISASAASCFGSVDAGTSVLSSRIISILRWWRGHSDTAARPLPPGHRRAYETVHTRGPLIRMGPKKARAPA